MKKKYYLFEMDANILNYFSLILLVVILLISFAIDKELLFESFRITNYFLFLLLMLGYLCLHELLHSLGYVINGANFKKIIYGVALEKGVLYCLCKQNISKKNIIWSLVYPLIFIGLTTYIIALIYKLPMLFILSIVNIAGSIGDIIMFIFISKLKDIEFSEYDSELGFAIYSSEDLSNEKPFGLKYVETKNEIKRTNFKKINISKKSIVILTILIVLTLIIRMWIKWNYIIHYLEK